jgi:hypothetical protein
MGLRLIRLHRRSGSINLSKVNLGCTLLMLKLYRFLENSFATIRLQKHLNALYLSVVTISKIAAG